MMRHSGNQVGTRSCSDAEIVSKLVSEVEEPEKDDVLESMEVGVKQKLRLGEVLGLGP
jgi:hypothetical protein